MVTDLLIKMTSGLGITEFINQNYGNKVYNKNSTQFDTILIKGNFSRICLDDFDVETVYIKGEGNSLFS